MDDDDAYIYFIHFYLINPQLDTMQKIHITVKHSTLSMPTVRHDQIYCCILLLYEDISANVQRIILFNILLYIIQSLFNTVLHDDLWWKHRTAASLALRVNFCFIVVEHIVLSRNPSNRARLGFDCRSPSIRRQTAVGSQFHHLASLVQI